MLTVHAVLAGALLLALLVAAVATALRRTHPRNHVPLAVAGIAALAYLVNLAVQVPILALLRGLGPSPTVFALVMAPAVYGVCEELARYSAFAVVPLMRAHRSADGALLAGLGHGGAEVLVLALAYRVLAGNWPAFEWFVLGRMFAVAVHIGLATLVVLAARRRRALLAVAIVGHVLVDASTFALAPHGGWLYALFALWAGAALILVALVHRRGLLDPPALATVGPATEVETA